jgi:hypothetical protein
VGRTWAVVIGYGIVLCASLAWLFNTQFAPEQIGVLIGAALIALGLLALLMAVGPIAAILDRVGLGRPKTPGERRLSFAFGLAFTGSVWLLQLVRGARPGFLVMFVWLAVTFVVLTVLYLGARQRLLSALA